MRLSCGIAIVLAGCTINGKAYGPGPSSPSTTQASNASSQGASPPPANANANANANASAGDDRSDLYTADGRVREDARYYKEQAYASAPADPWAGVANDQPVRWATPDRWVLRENEAACTAKLDHCLVKEAWFVIDNDRLEGSKRRSGLELTGARWQVYGSDGFMSPANTTFAGLHSGDITAYRTVPATRHNVAPGVIAIGLPHATPVPASARASYELGWTYGIVEEVDFDIGVYRLKGDSDTRPLAGARIAVLSWRPGEKVQIVGGKRRDQLAVQPTDVFLPPN